MSMIFTSDKRKVLHRFCVLPTISVPEAAINCAVKNIRLSASWAMMPLLFLLMMLAAVRGQGQTTLTAGDIAIIAVNTSDPDKFSVVLLKDVTANTVINFTDNGMSSTTTGRTDEGFLTYTFPSNRKAGSILLWTKGMTISGTGWNSNNPPNFDLTSGDQIFAFQGPTANWATQSGIVLLYGINTGSSTGFITTGLATSNTSYQPTGMTLGTNLNVISGDNGYFANGNTSQTSVSISGSSSSLISSISNSNNWFTNSSQTTFPTYSITVPPIAAWDFTGIGNQSISSYAATTFDGNLISTSSASHITRGPGAAWSVASNSWRTTGFQNNGISTSNTDYFQVTLTAASGFTISLSTIDAKFGGTATFYNTNTGVKSQFAYSLDGTNFTLIGSEAASQLLTMTQIDLSGISGLQNVAAGTTITLRYYATGQTATGGWGFLSETAGTNGLAIGGAVTSINNYYSKPTGNLNDVANWGNSPDGNGTAPTNFTSANQVFNIRNNATPTIGAAWTVSGTNSKIVVGDGTNACNFTIPALHAVTGTIDVSAGGTLTNTNTSIPTLGTLNSTSTIVFNAAGAQTVPIASYGNLSVSNTGSSTATAAGAISVTNVLTISSGSTFNMSTFALSGSSLTTSGSGTLQTSNTSSTPLPSGRTWSMDVAYNSSSSQTVIAGTYANLNLTGGARTLIANGTINISGTYTPGVGTLTVTNNTINFNGADGQTIPAANYNVLTSTNNTRILANGVIKIASTFTPGSSNYTIGTSTVEFNGSSAQTIPVLPVSSGGNYYNLTYSGNSIGTLGGSITVAGNFVQSAGNFQITSISSASAVTLNVTGNVTLSNAAILNLLNSTINGASATLNVTGNTTTSGTTSIFFEPVNNSNASGIAIFQTNDFTTTSQVSNIIDFGISTVIGNEFRISGNFSKSGNGKFHTSSSSASTGFVFNKSGTQTFSYSGANSSNTQYVVNSGSTLQLLTSLTMGAFTNPTSTFKVIGTLDMGTNVISGTTHPTFTVNAGGTIITSNTGGLATAITTPGTNVFTAGANYTFNGETTTAFPTIAQQASFGNPANINVNANITLGRDITVSGTLTQTSGKLTIGSFTLTLNGAYSGDATNSLIGGSTSNLTTSGTTGTLYFDQTTPGTSNVLRNLTLNSGSTTLGNTLNITAGSNVGTVTVGSGAALTTGDYLILKSDANGTARIGNSAGTISGNVTVERYIPAKRAWRFLAAPLIGSSNNSIFYNWQNNGSAVANYGVELWSPTGTTAPSSSNNGMALGGATSIKAYNSTTNGWDELTNTITSTLFDGTTNKAYGVFVTGPFTTNSTGNIYTGATATTLKATGTLIQGTHTKSLGTATAGQYFLVANPYASSVNPATITLTNIANNFYMWDPNCVGSYNVGQYTTYSKSANTYTLVGGGSGSVYVSGTTPIQSGQAFFVQAAAAGATSLTFNETDKVSGSTNVFRTSSSNVQTLRHTLKKNINGVVTNIDGALGVFYNGANAAVDYNDAVKFNNSTENIILRRANGSFAIEERPLVTDKDTLFVRLTNTSQSAYTLELTGENFTNTPGLTATLKDAYKNTSLPLSITDTNRYNFAVDANAASTGDRFMIVFKANSTLPVQFTNINAIQKGAAVQVDWKVATEKNIKQYVVEKSTNGTSFTTIATQAANNIDNSSYTAMDNSPINGSNYYRILSTDNSGKQQYSNVAVVKIGGKQSSIGVYPNPVINNTMNLQLENIVKGNYTIQLVNPQGSVVMQTKLQHAGGSGTQSIQIPTVSNGNYVLKATAENGMVFTEKVVVGNKF